MIDFSKYQEYFHGYKLQEDEYLLKVNEDVRLSCPTGFFTKMNKDGSLPSAFNDWGSRYYSNEPHTKLPIYVIKETFQSGWRLNSWRFGKSQNWASLMHPDGFTLEIYLTDFLDVLKNNTIINGEIQGKFKWEKNKLVKEPSISVDHILQLIPGALS